MATPDAFCTRTYTSSEHHEFGSIEPADRADNEVRAGLGWASWAGLGYSAEIYEWWGIHFLLRVSCIITWQVAKVEDLSSWKLYLVDWGYNTVPERMRAAANPRITVIDKAEFAQLLSG